VRLSCGLLRYGYPPIIGLNRVRVITPGKVAGAGLGEDSPGLALLLEGEIRPTSIGRHAECPGEGSGETRAVGEPVENPTNRHQEKADREAEYAGLSPGDRSRPSKSGGGEETGVDEGAEDPESSKEIEHPARISLWLQIIEERDISR